MSLSGRLPAVMTSCVARWSRADLKVLQSVRADQCDVVRNVCDLRDAIEEKRNPGPCDSLEPIRPARFVSVKNSFQIGDVFSGAVEL